MNFKSWILPLVLGGTMSGIYFLPKVGAIAESAVNMELSDASGNWYLQSQPPSEKEVKVLSADTRFSKAVCYRTRPGEYDEDGKSVADVVQLSVVLSGLDINNSIHRPERCMPAQGHTILNASKQMLKLPGGR